MVFIKDDFKTALTNTYENKGSLWDIIWYGAIPNIYGENETFNVWFEENIYQKWVIEFDPETGQRYSTYKTFLPNTAFYTYDDFEEKIPVRIENYLPAFQDRLNNALKEYVYFKTDWFGYQQNKEDVLKSSFSKFKEINLTFPALRNRNFINNIEEIQEQWIDDFYSATVHMEDGFEGETKRITDLMTGLLTIHKDNYKALNLDFSDIENSDDALNDLVNSLEKWFSRQVLIVFDNMTRENFTGVGVII